MLLASANNLGAGADGTGETVV